MVVTHTLVAIALTFGLSSDRGMDITAVPGFTSEQACIDAGNQAAMVVNDHGVQRPAKTHNNFSCVAVKSEGPVTMLAQGAYHAYGDQIERVVVGQFASEAACAQAGHDKIITLAAVRAPIQATLVEVDMQYTCLSKSVAME